MLIEFALAGRDVSVRIVIFEGASRYSTVAMTGPQNGAGERDRTGTQRGSTIELAGGFSVHDYRTKLKLLKDSGTTRTLENREGLLCPACEREFDRLFVTEEQTTSFETPAERPFCLARTDEKLLLCTH
ncbi:hypothetical protein C481_07171 [Natrialba asiatica DSM 12278]|uniref:Flagella cluster protein n=2 Tax=Natrialba asiatica TaxID=64602 RepID=M0AUP9_NATA1|nr:hypothetical protein C481_07171 [Natrialba asiatica DSM 12278]